MGEGTGVSEAVEEPEIEDVEPVEPETPPAPPPPPPPPPLPSANGIFPLSRLTYPKDAQDSGAAGEWVGQVRFSAGGGTPQVLNVMQATGNRSLDDYAERVMQRGLRYPTGTVDYVAKVTVRFSGAPDYEVDIIVSDIDYAE